MIKMLEHPRLASLVLAALIGLVSVATIRVATAPADRVARVREPMPKGMCGHAVSEWLREHGEDNDED